MIYQLIPPIIALLALITINVMYYNVSRERLTGKYYIRRYLNSSRNQVIVQYKMWGYSQTKVATEKDIKILKKKYDFKGI